MKKHTVIVENDDENRRGCAGHFMCYSSPSSELAEEVVSRRIIFTMFSHRGK